MAGEAGVRRGVADEQVPTAMKPRYGTVIAPNQALSDALGPKFVRPFGLPLPPPFTGAGMNHACLVPKGKLEKGDLMKLAWGLVFALLLSGCASSHVLVGQTRPAISAEQVKVYLEPPAQYETIALLEASNRGKLNFTEQGRTNTVLWRLKEEAAALGANGLLLQGMGNQYAGSVGTGNAWASGNSAYGIGFSSAVTNRVGNGLAIYVADATQSGLAKPEATNRPQPDSSSTLDPSDTPGEGVERVEERYEPDPAKRCVACERLRSSVGG